MRTKFLSIISRLVTTRPWTVIFVSIALAIVCAVSSAFFLKMNTDQDDLTSEKLAYHKRYKDYLREFGDTEYMFVVVENHDLPRAKEFIRSLATKLGQIPEIKEVTYQISNPKLEKSFLLYLPKDQLNVLGDFMPKLGSLDSLAGVFTMMNGEVAAVSKAKVDKDREDQLKTGFIFLDNLLDGIISAAEDGTSYKPFMQQAFIGGERAFDEDGFLLSENGKLLFVMIMPEKNYKTLSVVEEPLKKIRAAMDETRKDFPEVKAGLTGRPVLAADEMKVSDTDMTLATIAALLIVTLIFIAYFRRPVRPAMAAFALVLGIVQTLGAATLFIGHLNILSIVFAVILIGAGIEFGLQIVSRYREELAASHNVTRSIEIAITQTGKGNITAAITTAAAFFASCFTDFLALQELGFIAGAGILLCLLNMFTVLPAMMFIADRGKRQDRLNTTLKIDLKGLQFFYQRAGLVLLTTLAISIAAIVGVTKVGFDHNLLNLQAKGLESVEYEMKIINESSQSTWFAPFIAANAKDSEVIAKKLRGLSTVGKVETVSEVVPDDQDEKIALVAKLRESVGASLVRPKKSGSLNYENLRQELKKFSANVRRLAELALSSGDAEAVEALEGIANKADSAAQLVSGHEHRVGQYEAAFMEDLAKQINMLKSGFFPEKITLDDMPQTLRNRYVSAVTGRYQLYAYPKIDIWDPVMMENFISELRSVDPNVTGTPVEVYESSKLLEKSFKQAALFSLVAILVVVFIDFKNVKLALFAVTPLGLGVLWLFGLMGFAGIKFNLANFFGIPILLGVGIDNAVQIVHRYVKEREISGPTLFMTRSTGVAVLLTSLTTFASFATMTFARHQGIASLGMIMSLGTLTCFIGSMIVLPSLLKKFGK